MFLMTAPRPVAPIDQNAKDFLAAEGRIYFRRGEDRQSIRHGWRKGGGEGRIPLAFAVAGR
jgi:hypothetical protein